MTTCAYSDSHDSAEKRPEYWAETLALEFISEVWQAMQDKGLSQADLAKRLQKQPAYVSRVLNGPHNLTLRTIAEFLTALDRGAGLRFVELRKDEKSARSDYAVATLKVDNRRYRSFETLFEQEAVADNDARFALAA